MPLPSVDTAKSAGQDRLVLHARIDRSFAEQIALAKARLGMRGNGDLIALALDEFFRRRGIFVPPEVTRA